MQCRIRWLLAAAAACVAAQEHVDFSSVEKERALGARLAAEVRGNSTLLGCPAAREYVARLGQRLAAEWPHRFPYTFELIAGSWAQFLEEPLSLPGGYIFVPAGLFAAARDEAEFAGMLAHAMAHIAARHGMRLATRGQIIGKSSALVYMGGWTGYGTVLPLEYLNFTRRFELEADRLAAPALAHAGVDPGGLLRYVERNQPDLNEERQRNSPLPPRETRLAELRNVVENQSGAWRTAGDYQEVRRVVLAITPRPQPMPPSLRNPR
jgi:predicted Zn-dependent protease